ncbi:hypothetical protein TELCIR_14713 [Teladorsagia circumcincta]|uniref:Exocyst complex component Sec10-like alpha-helical bundle domain-containing protein n=1 Tax=Teladorsagia circumcincta TaxID=45464 RepID=A0A2G9U1U9_TELCI|nr:hypothetical protein TELCIR_14713 [Teladorsagia circumcincta]
MLQRFYESKKHVKKQIHSGGGTVVEQCVAKKWSSSLRSLEQKINMGLERQLNAIIGYVRFVLTSEQKKADFRPDNQQINLQASAVRIKIVVAFVM